ncbi:hypothetical protein C3L23_03795 [Nautilia sp. PV-1]|jgi:hypothetical protein|uniref:PDGLE domain-containing protein n=1 Tax=Nautilia sp. PV-1 TaxID=2579250 RepID=UPI000FD90329|nr:PDGLE domain-containing protein [Nautilia sp. PV-1]AZV46420.1 hypothetical protein C3L23_03795 [Nautilia sp. PV-1]
MSVKHNDSPKTFGEKIAEMSTTKKIVLSVLAILIVFVPLGLLDSADAYGEWDPSWYKEHLGFVPQGLVEWGNKFQFPHLLPDYGIPGANEVLGYYVSAIVGVVLLFAVYFILAKIISNKNSSK